MAMAHYQLGMAALNLGQIPEAAAAFEAYLKVDPNGPKAAEVKAVRSRSCRSKVELPGFAQRRRTVVSRASRARCPHRRPAG